MKRIFLSLLILFLTIVISCIAPEFVQAQTPSQGKDCSLASPLPTLTADNPEKITITVKTKGPCFDTDKMYVMQIDTPNYAQDKFPVSEDTGQHTLVNELSFPLQYAIPEESVGKWTTKICGVYDNTLGTKWDCSGQLLLTTEIEIANPASIPKLSYSEDSGCLVQKGHQISFNATGLTPDTDYVLFYPKDCNLQYCDVPNTPLSPPTRIDPYAPFHTPTDETSHTFTITPNTTQTNERVCLDTDTGAYRTTSQNCAAFDVTDAAVDNPGWKVCLKDTPPPPHPPCSDPVTPSGTFTGCKSVYTGLGVSISTNPSEFIADLFRVLLSISGGILLLLIILSGYQMMTSQGNPESIHAARDRITSAIVGFMFLIFSLVILEAIGVDILHIPGFSGTASQSNSKQQPAPTNAPLPSQPKQKDPKNCGEEGKTPCLINLSKFGTNDGCRAGLNVIHGVCQKPTARATATPVPKKKNQTNQTQQSTWLERLLKQIWGTKSPTPTPTPRIIHLLPSPTPRRINIPTPSPTKPVSSLPTVTPTTNAQACQKTIPCKTNADCAVAGCSTYICKPYVDADGVEYPDDSTCKPK